MNELLEKIDSIDGEIVKLGNLSHLKIDLNKKLGHYYASNINDCISSIRQSLEMMKNTLETYEKDC